MTHALHTRTVTPALAARLALALFALPVLMAPAAAAEGEALFRQQCGTCHSVKRDDGPRAGPSLHGVVGRKAGSAADYEYSDALRKAGITWDTATLERWLTNSNEFLPGSVMNYRQTNDTVRREIIRFLQTSAAD
nr:c-type cytochrome [Azospirillum oleiclasticum]